MNLICDWKGAIKQRQQCQPNCRHRYLYGFSGPIVHVYAINLLPFFLQRILKILIRFDLSICCTFCDEIKGRQKNTIRHESQHNQITFNLEVYKKSYQRVNNLISQPIMPTIQRTFIFTVMEIHSKTVIRFRNPVSTYINIQFADETEWDLKIYKQILPYIIMKSKSIIKIILFLVSSY